ncbi:hypothetical protein [Blastococcus sp. TF02A-26]|uniref:hypothetical protein n=1 Tax=Blastococcus sp. TF02A-26 TaxID=2250577 RepID=UPI0011BE372F|nr:hypothetical protein [Blastococcus sp. TF02A-26]
MPDDDEEWWGYNAATEPGIRAFVLSTKALELAEDGLATTGGLAHAARMISVVLLWGRGGGRRAVPALRRRCGRPHLRRVRPARSRR